MTEPISIQVTKLVGGPFAVASADGQLVFNEIYPRLRDGEHVVLSFAGVETIISAFLNAAIGQLYGSLSEAEVRERLKVSDLSAYDLELLKRVVDNAKRYFANRERIDQSWRETLSGTE